MGVAALGGALLAVGHASPGPLPGFALLRRGPDGGSAWQGRIPGAAAPAAGGESIVYLPPHFSAAAKYPVVYILHGLPGSPYSVVDGMRFTAIADRLVSAGVVRPFVAVMPAGPPPRYGGEWAGRWARYVVAEVLPWAETHLPLAAGAAARTLAGYSAGGFGAVDIGLRHPSTFATLEAWSGYFQPPHDGPFRHASAGVLRANDPERIVRREAVPLRRRGTRIFLSVGSTRDRWTEARTLAFAAELRTLRLRSRLWLAAGGHDGRFWRRQLPAALEYAVPAASRGSPPLSAERAQIGRWQTASMLLPAASCTNAA